MSIQKSFISRNTNPFLKSWIKLTNPSISPPWGLTLKFPKMGQVVIMQRSAASVQKFLQPRIRACFFVETERVLMMKKFRAQELPNKAIKAPEHPASRRCHDNTIRSSARRSHGYERGLSLASSVMWRKKKIHSLQSGPFSLSGCCAVLRFRPALRPCFIHQSEARTLALMSDYS